MRLRSFALMLTLLLGSSPLVGIVCAMDCEQPSSTTPCHESMGSPDGPSLRGTGHICDHDHTTGKPALLVSSSTRESVGTILAVPAPTLAHVSLPDAHLATPSWHGPPGLNGGSTSSGLTVLRI